MTRRILAILVSPVLTAALLGAAAWENSTHVAPAAAEAYHQRVRDAASPRALPTQIGLWVGDDIDPPTAANRLLKPNVILMRRFQHYPLAGQADLGSVSVLLVACKDVRDMLGHYPPVCYRGVGMVMEGQEARTWKIGELTLPGVEYRFAKEYRGIRQEMVIYNFMVAQGQRAVPHMDALAATQKNYRQRLFGAAQVQVAFYSPLNVAPATQRDEVMRQFLEEPRMYAALEALLSGDKANE